MSTNDDLKRSAEEAWTEVLRHPAADLKTYLESCNVTFRGNVKPVADNCPLCQSRKKFGLFRKGEAWGYKCFQSTCPANESGVGLQKYLEVSTGCGWKEARRTMHEITGVPDPWQEHRANRGGQRETTTPETEPETPEPTAEDDAADVPEPPEYIHIPDIGCNAYEAAWKLMTLLPRHRKELREKRGLPDKWIDALGFRSSRGANRKELEPLLEQFPPNELLRCGLAVRRKDDWKTLKIADQLCGGFWEDGEWVDCELPVIPFIDAEGRIVGLRPHKRGLSNGAHREDEASDFYDKNHHSLMLVYGEHFLTDRPEEHAHRCVLAEGEFKADALGYCGVPALGLQGISFLRNNRRTGQAVNLLVGMLRKHKIREVVVAFDHEDKEDKPVKHLKHKWIAEIHARDTAIILENHGFKVFIARLPDAWMEGGGDMGGWTSKGKADWDGRLAWHLRKAKGRPGRARAGAADEFEKLLRNRRGKQAPVQPVPRQMDWMASVKEDVIWQELNRLQFEPECFAGGKHEIEVAAEITGFCDRKYWDLLNVEQLAKALRKTHGGYYVVKPPNEKLAARVIKAKSEIVEMLDTGHTLPRGPDDENTRELNQDEIRGLRAAKLAADTTLYQMPKPFTNFTIESHYKVLVTEPDGTTRKDRLCVFIDANGKRTKPVQVNWEKMSSSQEARKIFLKLEGFHFSGGQNEIDAMVPVIDVGNYQKTIIEIDTYGHNPESGLILMGDCAVTGNSAKPFLFPDHNGIIWHRGIGYKNADTLETFCHKPPLLFPGDEHPKKIHAAIDWEQERREVAEIWNRALDIAFQSFGDLSGYAMIGALLQYIAHPETLAKMSGRPGLWVQGAKGSGKTQTVKAFMRMLGYIENYGLLGLTGTKVGIERSLSQFDSLPVHIDEWRNNRAPDDLVGFITNAYNNIAITKGTAIGSKSIRLSRAATMPVVTGEDMTTDAALLSRTIRLVMSSAARNGTKDEQHANFQAMKELAPQLYRIGRYLMARRDEFASMVVDFASRMMQNRTTIEAIRDERAREVASICAMALVSAQKLIVGRQFENQTEIATWFLEHGRTSSTDLEKDIFRLRWFSDCVTLITGGTEPAAAKFLKVRRGTINADGSVNIFKGDFADSMIGPEGRLFIVIASRDMFAAYQRDQSRQRAGVPIDIRNIMHELRKEPFWIPAPKTGNGTHRITIDGFHAQNWWILDYESCGDLKDIVRPILEHELYEHDLELDEEDGSIRRRDAVTPPLGI